MSSKTTIFENKTAQMPARFPRGNDATGGHLPAKTSSRGMLRAAAELQDGLFFRRKSCVTNVTICANMHILSTVESIGPGGKG